MTEFLASDAGPNLYTCPLCWGLVARENIERHEAFHTEWHAWMDSVRQFSDAMTESFDGVDKALKMMAGKIATERRERLEGR